MVKKIILKIGLIICFCLTTFSVAAQQVNTLYFMENVPFRNNLNPAFQPLSDFYFGLPVVGYTQFSLGNNSITLKDLAYKKLINDTLKSIYAFNKDGDKDKFFNVLKPTTLLQGDVKISLLNFGFRTGKSYWSFGLTERIDGNAGIPKDLLKFGLYGTPNVDNNAYNFKSLAYDVTAYTEAAFGYSTQINDRLSLGAKLKFLYGNFNSSMSNTNLDMTANIDQWTLKGETSVNYSAPDSLGSSKILTLLKPGGFGGGVDLGITFKPIEQLTLSAALLDLGLIRWTKNITNINNNVDYACNGIVKFNYGETSLNFQNMIDSLSKALLIASKYTKTHNSYTTYTSPKLNVGAEYAFFDNKLSLGVLSRTTKYGQSYSEELTASVNGRPVDWFNMSASYSVFNGKMSSVGAGLGLRTGFVSWVLAADYIPFYRSDLPISGSSFKVPLPYSTQGFNFSFGINLVLGNKKDTDKDGVVDKKDQCPETPFSVIVDKKGCPIDADGDGVPDYLDKCPRTPKEAYNKIDQNGCPVDNDSDGVADYKDKCPDTPIGVKVDSVGCPIDSDHDGVFDSLDKCPNTPLGVKVDSVGCPIDSDHDGVPDNIDKCPKTPLGVPVDSVGCPTDSDHDGVPDYIDKCPDTPIEERAMVDANGCTKKVTKSLVIEKTLINIDKSKNSQTVKKELQNLFKKALQGIQFESGKYTIRPISYKILNQIAGVLIANPTYLVEIRGHTDNAGKSAANMVLSTNRAKAVMKYLTGKKVPAERMTSNGYGDTLPVATNKTPTGRAINRRVEFIVSFEEITFE